MFKTISLLLLLVSALSSCQRNRNEADQNANWFEQSGRTFALWESEYTFEEYEEIYRKYVENYLGYYFWADSPNNLLIVRISMQGFFILQEIAISDNELVEGDKIILEQRLYQSWQRTSEFTIKHSRAGRRGPSVLFLHSPVGFRPFFTINFPSQLENASYRRSMNPYWSVFVNYSGDVINTYHSFFSQEAQKRFTGRFVFKKYEILQTNLENSIDKENIIKEIIIEMTESGWLIVIFFPAAHYDIDSHTREEQFFIGNREKTISFESMVDSEGNRLFLRRYFFEDEDTIIVYYYRYGLAYRLTYRRENIY